MGNFGFTFGIIFKLPSCTILRKLKLVRLQHNFNHTSSLLYNRLQMPVKLAERASDLTKEVRTSITVKKFICKRSSSSQLGFIIQCLNDTCPTLPALILLSVLQSFTLQKK